MNRETILPEGKHPQESLVEMTELVLPNDTNLLGNLLGGRLMHWIDIAGATVAQRHANRIVATVFVDNIEFRHPIRMGEVVVLKARLTWVGRSSMEVMVQSFAENFLTGKVSLANQAYITYVALGENNRPTAAPPLIPETDQEKELFREAEERHNSRLNRRNI